MDFEEKFSVFDINAKLMQQFKLEEDPIGSLSRFSSDELSLLNSRRRAILESPSSNTDLDLQNEQEIRQFKRQIDERFKLSIANKIYTFPRLIQTLSDIISSDQEPQQPPLKVLTLKQNNNRHVIDLKAFKKHDKGPKYKQIDTSKQFDSKREHNPFSHNKKGKDKLKTNDSTGKMYKDDFKEARGKGQNSNHSKKDKKKTERLKTEQASNSFMETMRSKAQKKN